MNRTEILQNVNVHSIDTLFEHVLSGVVSESELHQYGLSHTKRPELTQRLNDEKDRWSHCITSNDINSYRIYYKKYGQLGFKKVDKGCWENYATTLNTMRSYQDYLQLFSGHNGLEDKRGEYYFTAEDKIEELGRKLEAERQQVIEDMRQRPSRKEYKTWDALENLYQKGLITDELLIEEGIVPEHLIKIIRQPDMIMPQTKLNEYGQIPAGRTDIYFMGIPRSGKSCVLASFVYEASRGGLLDFIRGVNDEGVDHSEDYYYKLIQCIDNASSPQSTNTDTVSLMKFNLYQSTETNSKKSPITMVEISGECFNLAAIQRSAAFETLTKWEELGCPKIIKTPNRKLFFFLVDYSRVVADPEDLASEIAPEVQILSRALTTFKTDGTGALDKDGCNQDCTFSKVDTLGIIVTKSDLMNVSARDKRTDCAKDYLEKKYGTFTQQLKRICVKYNINRANHNIPYLLPFSMGRFIISNKVIYDNTDAKIMLEFIKANTRSEGGRGLLPSLF